MAKFQKGNKHGNRFRRGESGNPGGRAKGFGEMIRELGKDGKWVKVLDRLASSNTEEAKDRIAAIRELHDRAYGRPVQVNTIRTEDFESLMRQVREDVKAEVDDDTFARIAARFAKRAEEVEE